AWVGHSGTSSLLKSAIYSRKCTSCSTIGPLAPMVSELRSLGAGAPVLMVEPVADLFVGSVIPNSPFRRLMEPSWRVAFTVDHSAALGTTLVSTSYRAPAGLRMSGPQSFQRPGA